MTAALVCSLCLMQALCKLASQLQRCWTSCSVRAKHHLLSQSQASPAALHSNDQQRYVGVQALCKLAGLPQQLLDQLLNQAQGGGQAAPPSFSRVESQLHSGLASTLRRSFNGSQLAALGAVLGRPGQFSLVQVSTREALLCFASVCRKVGRCAFSGRLALSMLVHGTSVQRPPSGAAAQPVGALSVAVRLPARDEAWPSGVQGPPGTGKTATILGVASVLLARPPPQPAAQLPAPAAAPAGEAV